MAKQYISVERTLSPRPRSRRRRETGDGGSAGSTTVLQVGGGGVSSPASGSGHTHANKTTLDKLGTDSQGYVTTTEWVDDGQGNFVKREVRLKAGYSDLAQDLAADSPAWAAMDEKIAAQAEADEEKFLRKDVEDAASENMGFLKGLWVKAASSASKVIELLPSGLAKVKSLLVNGTWGIDDDGDATLHDVTANDVTARDATIRDVTVGSSVTENNSTTYEGGIQSVNYSSGQALIDGNGWKLWLEQNGLSRLEVDQLTVRLKAYFAELEIRKVSHAGGNLIFSAAASKIEKVVPESDQGTVVVYKCYLHTDDGTTATMNDWRVGDQALCQTFNVKSGVYQNVANRRYWRKVLYVHTKGEGGNDESYVGLAALASYSGQGLSYDNGVETGAGITNDIPAAGDTIVLLGHQYVSGSESEADAKMRQNAIAIESNSDTAPAIYKYQDISGFSINGKLVQADYYDSTEHKYQSVTYGDWYVGEKPANNGNPFSNNGSTYIRYRQAAGNPAGPLLEIKAKIEATSGSPILNEINSKARIYTLSSTNMASVDYHQNDIWILPEAYDGIAAGTVLVCVRDKDGSLTSQDWQKKDRYTDDAVFNTYISQIINGTSGSSSSEQVAQAIHAIKKALNENTSVDGGLILTNLIAMRENNNVWAGISGQYNNHIAAWFGGLMKDYEALTDEQKAVGWSVQKWAKSLFRFDGSGYLADGNISWEDDGDTTVKGTIKADNLFHAVCHYLEYGLPGTYHGSVLYYYKRENSHDETYEHFTNGNYYTAEQINILSDGHLNGGSPGFIATTGAADIVMCSPDPNHNWEPYGEYYPYVTLPKPEDFQGKVVEVGGFCYGTGASGEATVKNFEVHCVCGDLDGTDTRMTLLVWLSSSHNGVTTTSLSNKVTISTGGVARFLSVQLVNEKWVWVLLANQTGGDVYIGDGSISGGTVTSVRLSMPSGFSVSPSTITTNGEFAVSFGGTLTKNQVLATPASANGAPSWRSLVAADIPDLSGTYLKTTDISSWAKQSSKPSYQFSEIGGSVAASQLPTLYWANVAISNQSNNNTSPQFGDLRLRPGSNNYGSHLYFGDYSYCYLQEDSDDHLKIYGRNGVEITTDSGYDLTWGGYTLATQAWVGQQGYITSSAISDMATKTWVDSQSFVTESAFSGMLEEEAYISNGTIYIGGNSITPLTQHQSLSGCAQIGAHNNLTASSNEFTCAASGQSGTYYINYRTAGGSNGAITEYRFCDGAGNTLATISNGQFSGNAASAGYAGKLKYGSNDKVSANSLGALLYGSTNASNDATLGFNTDGGGHYNPSIRVSKTTENNGQYYHLIYTAVGGAHHFKDAGDTYADVVAGAFKKNGSSDSDVLLGGGGTKALTDFIRKNINGSQGDLELGTLYLNAEDGLFLQENIGDTDYNVNIWVGSGNNSHTCHFDNSYNDFDGYKFDAGIETAGGLTTNDTLVINRDDRTMKITPANSGYFTNTVAYTLYDNSGYALNSANHYFTGNIVASGSITQSSDIRKKDVSEYLEPSVYDMAQAPIVKFRWKGGTSGREHVGTVAQYWREVVPQLVGETPDGMLTMDYATAGVVAGVTAARKAVELERRIEEQDRRIEELEQIINQLKGN